MSKLEIRKLFTLPNGVHFPCGLNLREKLWWRFMPGVVINVRWPKGWVTLYEDPDGSCVSTESADPNDHYRPWMEANVGRQKWDWDWGMANNDVSDNRLTIKIRQKHSECAILAKLMWS
jgi:hypothetical protein